MKCRSVVLMRCGIILTVAALSCTSGCKSTSAWKMPSMFSKREPDADKLAGRVDSTPTSPANKYTPSAIASKAANSGSATKQTTQPAGLPYGNPTTASYAASAPTGGLAAQSNGYQTGPYTTNTGMPGTNAPSTGTNNSLVNSTTNKSNTQGFVSPYGGTYSGVATGSTNAPNVVTSAGQLPVNSMANGSVSPSTSAPNTSAPIGGLPAFGNAPPTSSAPNTLATGNVPAFPSMQNTVPSGANSLPGNPGALPAFPPMNNPLPTATASATASQAVTRGSGAVPAVSAYQSAVPSGAFAPGTTGRTTSYNFGLPAAPAPATPPQPRTMPPNTASGDQLLIR